MNTWEANIRKVVPYTPGEQPNQPDMIKLNTNENPYPPAPGVEKALHGIQPDTLRLYPDPTAGDLIHAIARSYGLKDEQVFVGGGADEVLAMSFLTFFNSDKPILFPDITYSFYDVWADLFRIPYECKALDENFCIRKEDYFGENGGIIFPNPNAPTGVELPLSDIEEILLHNRDVIVIVDEAYVDFGAKSALELIEKYDNLPGSPDLLQIPFHGWNAYRLCMRQSTADQISERCKIFLQFLHYGSYHSCNRCGSYPG